MSHADVSQCVSNGGMQCHMKLCYTGSHGNGVMQCHIQCVSNGVMHMQCHICSVLTMVLCSVTYSVLAMVLCSVTYSVLPMVLCCVTYSVLTCSVTCWQCVNNGVIQCHMLTMCWRWCYAGSHAMAVWSRGKTIPWPLCWDSHGQCRPLPPVSHAHIAWRVLWNDLSLQESQWSLEGADWSSVAHHQYLHARSTSRVRWEADRQTPRKSESEEEVIASLFCS